jgi:hypothetical protein
MTVDVTADLCQSESSDALSAETNCSVRHTCTVEAKGLNLQRWPNLILRFKLC